jgi:hypothetical protein
MDKQFNIALINKIIDNNIYTITNGGYINIIEIDINYIYYAVYDKENVHLGNKFKHFKYINEMAKFV